jgi:hypothetical protein
MHLEQTAYFASCDALHATSNYIFDTLTAHHTAVRRGQTQSQDLVRYYQRKRTEVLYLEPAAAVEVASWPILSKGLFNAEN